MKKVTRLTESDLVRIVKRVIKESECKSEMDASEFVKKLKNESLYGPDSLKVGTKSMYPKTYQKLKSIGNVYEDMGSGCVEMDGESLVFYKPYHGWLQLLQINCGDEIIRIPKVSPAVKNFMRRLGNEFANVSWITNGDSIYIIGYAGC